MALYLEEDARGLLHRIALDLGHELGRARRLRRELQGAAVLSVEQLVIQCHHK